MSRFSLFSAAALFAVTAAPAFAEPVVTGKRSLIDDDARPSRVVRFADLDLATAAGEATLMRRVRGAVSYVCSPAGNFVAESACRNYAWKGARPQLTLALDQARTSPALARATLSALVVSAPAR